MEEQGGPVGWKRGKNTAERRAEQDAKRARLEAQEGAFDPSQPFSLQQRQPWASKEREVNELTEEQKEHMAKLQVRPAVTAPAG